MTRQRIPTPSSSSSFVRSTKGDVSLRSSPHPLTNERTKIEEEERQLASFGGPAELGQAMTRLGLSAVEVGRLLSRYGAPACEGAFYNTQERSGKAGGLKRPQGWFIKTLAKGLQWSSGEIRLHIAEQERRQVEKWQQEGNRTYLRLYEKLGSVAAVRRAVSSPPTAGG